MMWEVYINGNDRAIGGTKAETEQIAATRFCTGSQDFKREDCACLEVGRP